MGPLLRANDARPGFWRAEEATGHDRGSKARGEISNGSGLRSVAAALPAVCFGENAHAGDGSRRGDEILSAKLLLRREASARRSDAWHVRLRVSELQPGEDADYETAGGLQNATG